mmetsp:Transcript_116625/g.324985  ORF Transcript_116625/g.324985 Transcript_116625/m.324985 type:complete len:280 (+) Transcript_116625:504-1343(+)
MVGTVLHLVCAAACVLPCRPVLPQGGFGGGLRHCPRGRLSSQLAPCNGGSADQRARGTSARPVRRSDEGLPQEFGLATCWMGCGARIRRALLRFLCRSDQPFPGFCGRERRELAVRAWRREPGAADRPRSCGAGAQAAVVAHPLLRRSPPDCGCALAVRYCALVALCPLPGACGRSAWRRGGHAWGSRPRTARAGAGRVTNDHGCLCRGGAGPSGRVDRSRPRHAAAGGGFAFSLHVPTSSAGCRRPWRLVRCGFGPGGRWHECFSVRRAIRTQHRIMQ